LIAPNAFLAQYSLPSYNTFALRVGVEWKDWSLELYGKNLTDAKGIESFAPYSYTVANGLAPSVGLIEPRVIGLVLRGKI